MIESIDFDSRQFVIHPLVEGVYAAIATNGGHAICNAGLVDLGGQVLAFDSFISPQAATDLLRFSMQRFGRPPSLVINSHYHNDHIWGNQVFTPAAPVISSDRTRQLIATSGKEELEWYSAHSSERLESLRVQYKNATDEKHRNETLLWIGEYEAVLEALPHLSLCSPNITFENRLEIHGTRRSASLTSFEEAHTGSDTILYLPQDGIVFLADLLFVGCHPYLGDGDPFKLIQALHEVSLLDAASFVPGHGPVGSIADVKLLIEYIEECLQTARVLLNAGDVSETRINELEVPEKYRDWQVSMFYPVNVKFLCQCLGTAESEHPAP